MLSRLRENVRTSVRARLLAIALLPLLLALPVLMGMLLYWGNAYFDRLLIFKVKSDLVVADQFFDHVLERAGRDVEALAQSYALVSRLRPDGQGALARMLDWKREDLKLDFLRYYPLGAVSLDDWLLLEEAAKGRAGTAIDIYAADQLAAIRPALARQARLNLVPTANAAAGDRTVETRGMVVHAAVPVSGADGVQVGVLEGGVLLNQNLGFVDTINDLIYRPDTLLPGSKGTATLFLDDVRIATNVRLFEGGRALGTRVSQAVRDRVLGQGRTWYDRAFVVNAWYISGYEPILDSEQRRVGMLYVGYLERPFQQVKLAALGAILLLFLAAGGAGAVFFWRLARTIFKPLERMNATISAVEAGDLDARTGTMSSRDEIGRVARHLDQLLDQLRQRNRELKDWAESLDNKVAARTRDLEQANRLLLETQRKLVMSEKLAAIGEITAGVAHEINNPIAVMQGNLDLMRVLLGHAAAPVAEEIRLLDQQIQRIQVLVQKLLQFAQPAEYAGYMESVEVNGLMEDCQILVRHLLSRGHIAVERETLASRPVRINRNELQQVLINLIVNAIQSMPAGGTLKLETRDREGEGRDKGVTITVRDTGSGIPREHLERIFDPFFSTKGAGGSGLGLSISYTLVARYGGTITVESEPGVGTSFHVNLPCDPLIEPLSV
jgi:two-component system NtrC family sensor kinase